jgi:glycolate oxidase FAD binding subunit
MAPAVLRPQRVEELAEAVRASERVRPRGAGTKTALSAAPPGVATLDVSALRGVIEYEPGEFTFTALAGTPVREVEDLLAEHGQYLPFDPLLARAGATLGGTVAAGLSGPGRLRYGGARDFLLGVRFADGEGRLVRGGGKVVKNAAGFDFPKLLVGSLGELGVIAELTFKVFPRRSASRTLVLDCGDDGFPGAVEVLAKLMASSYELLALELMPPGRLLVRLAGAEAALDARIARIAAAIGRRGEVIAERAAESAIWDEARELAWRPRDSWLVKVPLDLARLAGLEGALARWRDRGAPAVERRYSAGGSVGWIAWPETQPLRAFEQLLAEVGAPGLVVLAPQRSTDGGSVTCALLNYRENAFLERVRAALDPAGRLRRAGAGAGVAG